MFNGPKSQDPDDKNWQTFEEFSNSKSGASPFSYNPAASDITTQSGDFPEPSYQENPEKM